MAKTYIQKAIDKTLRPYESSNMSFLKVDEKDIEDLRNKLYSMIIGNEDSYKSEIDERIAKIYENLENKNLKEEEKLSKLAVEKFGEDVDVNLHNEIPKNAKLNKKYEKGKAVGIISTLAVVLATTSISCGKKDITEEVIETEPQQTIETVEENNTVEEIDENKIAAEQILMQFSTNAKENTTETINNLLKSGVKLVDKNLSEESQKDLISGEWLQYYLVANIDNITTLEYANFMKEQPGAVLDNDDLIYNFKEMNNLLKDQMLVATLDNKVDFSNLYMNENDVKLLNDGADILARLNAATKKDERKEISKEFYDFVYSLINDSTNELKYSNSALATFINAEFGAWCELTKSSNYKLGYYPDDELEAKLMTVVSNCGMSKGEASTLNIEDETKKSLESINNIRVLDSLNERKENIENLISMGQLYYLDEANYKTLRVEVSKNVNLENYVELESYTEKQEKAIKSVKPQVSKDDSGISNGEGGTISKEDMIQNGVNPTDPNAKEKYEENVRKNTEKTEFKDNTGNVVDKEEAAKWAKQGAIDAANGINNVNSVPELYKSSYTTGWNEAKKAIEEANKNNNDGTKFQPTTPTVVDKEEKEEKEDFKDDGKNAPSEETTIFVPVGSGETISEETVTNSIEPQYSNREIEVKVLTRDEKVESYKELKSLLQEAMNSYQEAITIYDEIETNHMSK